MNREILLLDADIHVRCEFCAFFPGWDTNPWSENSQGRGFFFGTSWKERTHTHHCRKPAVVA